MVRQFFRIIDEQANHMHSLISDLLDAGRIETGTLSVSPEPVTVAELGRPSPEHLPQWRRTAHLANRPAAGPSRGSWPTGNASSRSSTISFSNASRYSPESAPIRVSAMPDGIYVSISVADDGRGVPPEQLPHLFRKQARSGFEGGAGLGLTICEGADRSPWGPHPGRE